jgi:hypothetical protein
MTFQRTAVKEVWLGLSDPEDEGTKVLRNVVHIPASPVVVTNDFLSAGCSFSHYKSEITATFSY